MKISTERIGDEQIEIEVTPSGRFEASFNEEDYRAETKGELLEILRAAVGKAKQARAPLPVTLIDRVRGKRNSWDSLGSVIDGRGTLDMLLRGVHARTRVVMLLDGEKKIQLDTSWGNNRFIARRLNSDEKAEYEELTVALDRASAAYNAFKAKVLIDPKDAMENPVPGKPGGKEGHSRKARNPKP